MQGKEGRVVEGQGRRVSDAQIRRRSGGRKIGGSSVAQREHESTGKTERGNTMVSNVSSYPKQTNYVRRSPGGGVKGVSCEEGDGPP